MKTELQVLTLKGVKKKAREYYRARKLTAQHRDPKKRECCYKIGAYRCAIGASLTEKTLERLQKDEVEATSENSYGYANGACNWMSPYFGMVDADAVAIRRIQAVHDQWCGAAHDAPGESKLTNEYRNEFLVLIGLKKP